VVICDLQVGADNGLRLLEHAARLLPTSTRILISGALHLAGTTAIGLLHGQIAKPFLLRELLELLPVGG
jgi:hypothetical protein